METFSYQTRFKNLEGKPERKSPKRTISASGGFESLQMISKPDTERYVNEEAKSQRGWTRGTVPNKKDVGPRRGVDWESHIDWRMSASNDAGS